MKTFKFPFATFTLVVATLAILFFSSCQKEQNETLVPQAKPEKPIFTKEISLTDTSGNNNIVVRLSAESASILEDLDVSQLFRIEPIFEAPKEEFTSKSASEEPQDSRPTIDIEIVSQNLEPGAVGLRLIFDPKDGVQERWQYVYTYTTFYDRIQVSVWSGCYTTHYYRKLYSSSPFTWIASFYNICATNWTGAYSIPSYQMRAKIYYNSNTWFTISVW